jgi:hypothetical protein
MEGPSKQKQAVCGLRQSDIENRKLLQGAHKKARATALWLSGEKGRKVG